MSSPLREATRRCLAGLETGRNGEFTARFVFPADFPGFRGHFPGQPVLPGVCTIQALTAVAERLLNRPMRLKEVVLVKFYAPVTPDTVLTFAGRNPTDEGGLIAMRARVTAGTAKVAELSLRLTADPGAEH